MTESKPFLLASYTREDIDAVRPVVEGLGEQGIDDRWAQYVTGSATEILTEIAHTLDMTLCMANS